MTRWILAAACYLFLCGMVRESVAADVFLTIGGGPDPTNNQVSLEKNVQFFQRTIAQARDDQPRHEIYFADGGSDQRDLQFRDNEATISDAEMWMSTLAGNEQQADLSYRNHQVTPVAGPSRKAFLRQALKELSQSMSAGDRLLIYVTAHGGPSVGQMASEYGLAYGAPAHAANEFDTTIALWNDETLSVSEFTRWLNDFGPDVQIIMVMAQCYSGGFGHAIYHDGNARLGISARPRCGFFSQRHDRPSAGCTPDVLEAEYQDYSTFFWAALAGVDRLGRPIDSADYDNNGTVGFAEAHAYAMVTGESLDIPLKTSGVLLRRYAKMGVPVDDETEPRRPTLSGAVATFFGGDDQPAGKPSLVYDAAGLLTRQSTIGGALELSSPDQRVVLEHLSKEFDLAPETTVQQVRRKFRRAGTKLETRREAYVVKAAEYELLRSQLNEAAEQEYPELRLEGYAPIMTQLTSGRADEFLEFVTRQPQAHALTQLAEQLTKAADEVSQQEIREAGWGRLLTTLEDILLEENLPETAAPDVMDHYGRILIMERGSLAPLAP